MKINAKYMTKNNKFLIQESNIQILREFLKYTKLNEKENIKIYGM